MAEPRSFTAAIDLWPTLQDFANDANVDAETARGWHRRNSIPSYAWADIVAGSRRRRLGITAALLAALAKQKAA